MNEQRTYGDAVAHSHGLDGAPKLVTRTLRGSQISITRLSCGIEQIGMMRTIPAEDTFVAAVFLTDTRLHELWSHGRAVSSQGYEANSLRIVNLDAEFSSFVAYPHESVSFYIPRTAVDALAYEAGGRQVANLRCPPGIIDPVMAALTSSLLPAFKAPEQVSSLFIDHVALAITAHLVYRYGELNQRRLIRRGGLSFLQEQRAKEYLASHFGGDIALADVARNCGMSRGHFISSFRITTGLTPHKWLQQYRVQKAKALLLESSTAIAEIAAICGFADQSHLTRVFSLQVGASPAAWRREHQGRTTGQQ